MESGYLDFFGPIWGLFEALHCEAIRTTFECNWVFGPMHCAVELVGSLGLLRPLWGYLDHCGVIWTTVGLGYLDKNWVI